MFVSRRQLQHFASWYVYVTGDQLISARHAQRCIRDHVYWRNACGGVGRNFEPRKAVIIVWNLVILLVGGWRAAAFFLLTIL